MSDSSFHVIDRKERLLLDVIDQAWEQDHLSDDDIAVPKELEGENPDVENGEEDGQSAEAWNDLGIERMVFVQEKGKTANGTGAGAVVGSSGGAGTSAIVSMRYVARSSMSELPHQPFPQS